MPEILVQRASGEPLSLAEVKAHLRVTDTSQDTLIRALIAAAREAAESRIRASLLYTRWKLVLDSFPMAGVGTPLPFAYSSQIPPYAVVLPHAPATRVVSVRYQLMSGSWSTMPAEQYVLNRARLPGIVTPVFGQIWQIPLPQIGAVEVTYDAGYEAPVTSISGNNLLLDGPVPFAVGDAVRLRISGDSTAALPAGLAADTDYLVASANSDSSSITLQTRAGTAVTISGSATGQLYVGALGPDGCTGTPAGIRAWMLTQIGALYENREAEAIVARGQLMKPTFIDRLLDPYMWMLQ